MIHKNQGNVENLNLIFCLKPIRPHILEAWTGPTDVCNSFPSSTQQEQCNWASLVRILTITRAKLNVRSVRMSYQSLRPIQFGHTRHTSVWRTLLCSALQMLKSMNSIWRTASNAVPITWVIVIFDIRNSMSFPLDQVCDDLCCIAHPELFPKSKARTTTTPVPQNIPSHWTLPLSCEEDGFFRNPNDCHRFYRCHEQKGKFIKTLFDCNPANAVFDEQFRVCVPPEDTDACDDIYRAN